jgi:hypothetical protein
MTTIRCLRFAALIAASSLSTTAALANGYSDGVEIRPAVDGVTLYTVHSEPIPENEPLTLPPVQINNVVKVVIVEHSSRWWHYRRALGQRYLGFVRMYAGPRYPF